MRSTTARSGIGSSTAAAGTPTRATSSSRICEPMLRIRYFFATAAVIAVASCGFDRGDRYITEAQPALPICKHGQQRCTDKIQHCANGHWIDDEDCGSQGLVCVPGTFECKTCVPNAPF